RNVRLWLAVLEVMIQERSQNFAAEIKSRITGKLEGSQSAGIFNFLAMMPGTYDQEYFVIVRVFGLDSLIHGHGAVDVFLVPETVHQHYGDFEGLPGQNFVNGLVTPERVIARVFQNLAPE